MQESTYLNWETRLTEDGSETLYSKEFRETCHSQAGAITETRYLYWEGCDMASRRPSRLLEVGLGAGVGVKLTAKLSSFPLLYVSLEKDLELGAPNSFQDPFKLKVIRGDAQTKFKEIAQHGPFEAIYQDAFSPRKNPELWTLTWFSFLKSVSTPTVLLSTFSASTSVRKNLYQAGWFVFRRPGFAKKNEATVASLLPLCELSLSQELKQQLTSWTPV